MSERERIYNDLLKAFKSANSKLLHSHCDIEVSKIWKELKRKENFLAAAAEEICKFRLQASKKKLTLDCYWNALPKTSSKASLQKDKIQESILDLEKSTPKPVCDSSPIQNIVESSVSQPAQELSNSIPPPNKVQSTTPAQDKLKTAISNLQSSVIRLQDKKSRGIATDDDISQLKRMCKNLIEKEKQLKAKLSDQIRQKKSRDLHKRKIDEIKVTNPELAIKIAKRSQSGRPRLEESQPELLKAIVDIATYGCGADERRRSESIRTVQTLDELTSQLNSRGFQLKRSATYLRLLPKNRVTKEGQRHVNCVPVRLQRATNDLHKQHVDTKFCTASIRYLEELASLLGPEEVIFMSRDDKARVPIGKTAANKQAPLVMHLDYRVRLPDHDWIVAEKHKLIPSVNTLIQIEPGMFGDVKAVTYSGPTFIAIRSGKHMQSTALSHAKDFETIMESNRFAEYCKTKSGEFKPISVVTCDGGADENPRYEKTINCAIYHFTKYNFDAFFVLTNAPGRSAFNRVERCMAPLSRDLAGLLLNHEHYGTHLNEKGETVDVDLEKKNFEHAGKVLAEIWSETVINNFPVFTEYISEEDTNVEDVETVSLEWKTIHVRESHYFLQVVKCSNRTCCSAPRSSYFQVIEQFIPAPLCVSQDGGLKLCDNKNEQNNFCSLLLRKTLDDKIFRVGTIKEVPYDVSCPSLSEMIRSRSCDCGLYYGTKKSLKAHQRICRKNTGTPKSDKTQITLFRPKRLAAIRQNEKLVVWTTRLNSEHIDWFDDTDSDVEGVDKLVSEHSEINMPRNMPVIDIDSYMKDPFLHINDCDTMIYNDCDNENSV